MYYALDAEALQEASEIHIYMRKKAFEEGQQWRKAQNTPKYSNKYYCDLVSLAEESYIGFLKLEGWVVVVVDDGS